MTKKRDISQRIVYEESPWGDDDPILGAPIDNFFPPEAFKGATIRVFSASHEWKIDVSAEDATLLRRQAEATGVLPEHLIAGVMRAYLRQQEVRP